jgi:hypothetical protein
MTKVKRLAEMEDTSVDQSVDQRWKHHVTTFRLYYQVHESLACTSGDVVLSLPNICIDNRNQYCSFAILKDAGLVHTSQKMLPIQCRWQVRSARAWQG